MKQYGQGTIQTWIDTLMHMPASMNTCMVYSQTASHLVCVHYDAFRQAAGHHGHIALQCFQEGFGRTRGRNDTMCVIRWWGFQHTQTVTDPRFLRRRRGNDSRSELEGGGILCLRVGGRLRAYMGGAVRE